MYGKPEDYRSLDKCSDLIREGFARAKAARQVREAAWRKYEQMYDSWHDETKQTYDSKLFVPTGKQAVEGVTPKLAMAVLANDPVCVAKPREEGDVDRAEITTDLLDYQGKEPLDLHHVFPLWMRECAIFGTQIVKVDWLPAAAATHRMKFNPHTGEFMSGNFKTVFNRESGQYEKVEAGENEPQQPGALPSPRLKPPTGMPRATACDIWEMYPDDWGRDEDHCRFIIHRRLMSKTELRRLFADETHKWEQKAKALAYKSRSGPDEEQRVKHERETGKSGAGQSDEHDDVLLWLYDWWENEVHMVAVGDEEKPLVVLREPNPFDHGRKPFVVFRYLKRLGHFWGTGVIESVEDLITAINDVVNQRRDNTLRAINQLVFLSKQAGLDKKRFKSQPWGVWEVRGDPTRAVHIEQPSDATGDAYKEFEFLQQQLNHTVGLSSATSVAQTYSQESQTARGMAMLLQAGEAIFHLVVHQQGEGLRRLFKMVLELDRQYLTAEGAIRITGKKGATWNFRGYTPEDIGKFYDLQVTVKPDEANKAVWRQSFINTVAAIGGTAGAECVDWRPVAKGLFATVVGRAEAETYLLGEPESDWQHENALFVMTGRFEPVSRSDDHDEHLHGHSPEGGMSKEDMKQAVANGQRMGEDALANWRDHNMDHDRMRSAQGQPGGTMAGGMPPGSEAVQPPRPPNAFEQAGARGTAALQEQGAGQ